MDNATTSGHKLEVTLVDCALVAREVFVVDGTLEEVGNCFLATAWKKKRELKMMVYALFAET